MFFGFFFGFSRFLVLENLENPKKHNVFFGFFRILLNNPKNTMIFLGFSLVFIEKSKKRTFLCFWIFKVSAFGSFFGVLVVLIEKSKKIIVFLFI